MPKIEFNFAKKRGYTIGVSYVPFVRRKQFRFHLWEYMFIVSVIDNDT